MTSRHAVTGRIWRGLADARRIATRGGSARPATDLVEARRSDVGGWLTATSEAHERYRSAIDVPDGRVAIVCVSARPHLVAAVAANVERQSGLERDRIDVVYVANGDDIDLSATERELASLPNITVERLPSARSLGACLNRALEITDARFVAKFDDDDHYGSHHLADSLRAHSYAGAAVVGKHTYYAHLARTGDDVLRFPGREFTYSTTLAGGTLVIDRDRVDDQRFDDISLGEDRAFIRACHRRGLSTFAADRFNFTQVRTGNNTWTIEDDAFRRDTLEIDTAADEHRIDR